MFVPFLSTSLLLLQSLRSAQAADDSVLFWANSGGGWRSLMASMGYAHAFYRAGLISNTTSEFDLWSSTSGGSWFQLQFLYSQRFVDRILTETPEQVGEFALEWITAFATGLAESTFSPQPDPRCAKLIEVAEMMPGLSILEETCTTFAPFEWDYVAFIQTMLDDTSRVYGDPLFSQRAMAPENRVSAMKETNAYIQMTLEVNSRVDINTTVFLGPANDPALDYAVPIPLLYAVEDDTTSFLYAVDDAELPFRTIPEQSFETIDTADWADYYLFPAPPNAGIFRAQLRDSLEGSGSFRQPFGEQTPTVAQIAGATSSANAQVAPSAPLLFARGLSQLELLVRLGFITANTTTAPTETGLTILREAYNNIWQTPLISDFAICSQWPSECGEQDGRLTDGSNVDFLAVAQTVGQYQRNGDKNKTLKIILSNNNNVIFGNQDFLAYFNTTFLTNVAPGAFHWPLDSNGQYVYPNPRKSIQIFEEFMDDTTFLEAFEPIEGSNLTTARYSATTIDNPEFKVQAGWNVEILLLQINSIIPTIFDAAFIPNFVELAENVAANDELVRRIESFVDLQAPVTDSPTLAPNMNDDTSGTVHSLASFVAFAIPVISMAVNQFI